MYIIKIHNRKEKYIETQNLFVFSMKLTLTIIQNTCLSNPVVHSYKQS